ncbi:HlyD family type I secretion periplasmic adaptor subunit [Bradyrhizobium sp. USDA 4502]
MTERSRPNILISLQWYLRGAVAVIITFGVGVCGLAAKTQIAGAVIASGTLVVDSNVKKVQHPTGGVIGELRVRDGVRVRAGDVVMRLDETVVRANLAIVTKSIDELLARRAREEAERDGMKTIEFPPELLSRANDDDLARILAGEQRLFQIRRESVEGQKAQLRERIAQSSEEIRGYATQEEAKARQSEWIDQELVGVRDLWKSHLVQFTRVTTLERSKAALDGERGALISSIAQTKGKISEIELQILQLDQNTRTEVGKDLADIRAKLSELGERRVTAEDQLKRIDVRAPQDGVVHQLSVFTVGGVVGPGDVLMMIVPEGDALAVEAKLSPQDIDQVRVGQAAVLRFAAFNARTTPEINGKVGVVSADLLQDQRTGAYYYTVRITLPADEVGKLGSKKLVPGMPVDAYIQTSERSMLSYLLKPVVDRGFNAFREQ